MNEPVHSGGGVNTVVSAMLYDLGSVCTDVQADAELVAEAELEVGDPGAGVVVFFDVELEDETPTQ